MELLAAIVVELEGSLDRATVLERRGISQEAFDEALRASHARIAAATAAGDDAPSDRWASLVASARGARRSATTVRDRSRVRPKRG